MPLWWLLLIITHVGRWWGVCMEKISVPSSILLKLQLFERIKTLVSKQTNKETRKLMYKISYNNPLEKCIVFVKCRGGRGITSLCRSRYLCTRLPQRRESYLLWRGRGSARSLHQSCGTLPVYVFLSLSPSVSSLCYRRLTKPLPYSHTCRT